MGTSFVMMIALGIASQMAKARGLGHNQMKPMSVENCQRFGINVTSNFTMDLQSPRRYISLIKYYLYSFFL